MKKLVLLLALVITTFGFAQKQNQRKGDFKNLTPEQQATLQTKQMALDLSLNDSQMNSLMTLNKKQAEQRNLHRGKMEKLKEKGEVSADDHFKMKNEMLDMQLAYQNNLKKILNDEQFEKWTKTNHHRKEKMKRKQYAKGQKPPQPNQQ
ncbi:DUF4890 domain-containing protein [Namhaeicola litoreus]|uniref:DUF4890 domain-containing protein n=1 Tax=Namhaeicola litoreus TaxID=1052145 RepID=A0ABW3Y141_9FLAO